MGKPIVAAQMYTLRDFCQNAKQIDETFGLVKAMGYNAIQLSGMADLPPVQMRELADKYDLNICCTHIGFDEMLEDIDKVIKDHEAYGCKYPGIGGMPTRYYRMGAEGVKRFAKEANEVGRILADAGMHFIYHNHNNEFTRFGEPGNTKSYMDILFEETDPAAFQFELDTYWVAAGGAEPTYWINKVAGRMRVMHLKDMTIQVNPFTGAREQPYCEIGEGNLNWKGILAAAEAIGVEYMPVEQDICQRNPFDSLRISHDNLLAMGCAF